MISIKSFFSLSFILLIPVEHRSTGKLAGLVTQALITRGRKIEPGIIRSRMRQILHNFHVNCDLQDTCPLYVASGTSETNGGLLYRSLFVVEELFRPNSIYVYPVSHLLEIRNWSSI